MRFRIFISLSVILALLTLTSCKPETGENKKKVAVIVKSTYSDFWKEVEKGVNTAATEYNIDVTFEGPENEEDYVTQNEMINRAVANGVNAIVISAIDYVKSANALDAAALAGVKILTIDSEVESESVSTFIGTDNLEAGKMAIEAAAKQFPPDSELRIGILGCGNTSKNAAQRVEGIREFAASRGNAVIIDEISVASNLQSATAGAITMLSSHTQINIIIGVNEWMTLGIGNAIEKLGLSEKVCAIGFDSNVDSIGKLETGEIDALIVQNPFAIGYLGVQKANELIRGNNVETLISTKATAILKENMFEESNQKILFQFE